MTTWVEKLDRASISNRSLVCVGLDPDPRRMPLRDVFEFNRAIVDATHDLVCAYKPQLAFYEALGLDGLKALGRSVEHIRKTAPGALIIGDAKRGDIESTAEAYAKAMFEYWGFDVVTVHAYLGREAVEPFLTREGRGALIVCRTSNPGARELQDLRLLPDIGDRAADTIRRHPESRSGRDEGSVDSGRGRRVEGQTGASLRSGRQPGAVAVPARQQPAARLFEHVAALAEQWNTRGNVGLVIGATYPEELASIRRAHPSMPILVPGIGAQGGDVAEATQAAVNSAGRGAIISASRSIIYASAVPGKFPEVARLATEKLRAQIEAAVTATVSKGRG
ncbi:MAG: orotidine-5'-phosphate decarboxylase [Chloroflexi bacterium]|nr:orotidine-5'-phosphate decarboxylase [Chloroflexota bacterium]